MSYLKNIFQAFREFPQFVRAIEAIASSSSTGTANEEEHRKQLEAVKRMAVADGDSDLEVRKD